MTASQVQPTVIGGLDRLKFEGFRYQVSGVDNSVVLACYQDGIRVDSQTVVSGQPDRDVFEINAISLVASAVSHALNAGVSPDHLEELVTGSAALAKRIPIQSTEELKPVGLVSSRLANVSYIYLSAHLPEQVVLVQPDYSAQVVDDETLAKYCVDQVREAEL